MELDTMGADLPACQSGSSHKADLRLGSEPANFLLDKTASYLTDRAEYGEADPLYQRALAIREKALGNYHPYTATSLDSLASLYGRQGRYEEAEPLYHAPSPFPRKPWDQTTRIPPSASAAWQRSTPAKGATSRPSRSCSAPLPFARKHWVPTTPTPHQP
jgi:hypothetical protein